MPTVDRPKHAETARPRVHPDMFTGADGGRVCAGTGDLSPGVETKALMQIKHRKEPVRRKDRCANTSNNYFFISVLSVFELC